MYSIHSSSCAGCTKGAPAKPASWSSSPSLHSLVDGDGGGAHEVREDLAGPLHRLRLHAVLPRAEQLRRLPAVCNARLVEVEHVDGRRQPLDKVLQPLLWKAQGRPSQGRRRLPGLAACAETG